jgi:oligoendopeptidase F
MTTKTSTNLKDYNTQKLGNLPVWDLSHMYNSIDSKKIESDLNFIETKAKEFEKKYEGKISLLAPQSLLIAIEELELIEERMDKLISYAHLLYAENIENEKNKIFFQQIKEQITNFSSLLIFFSLEINSIDENKLKKLFQFKKLNKFKTWIEISRTYKPHQLDKNLEKLIKDKSITSSAAWIRLFDETIASLRFPFDNQKLSSAEILNYLTDGNPLKRKQSAKSIGQVLRDNVKIFTTITNTLAKDKAINDKWRSFPNPIRNRNLANVVEDEVVESLSNSVTSSYSKLTHRYYKMKANWFGYNSLKYWDRNAPLPFQNNRLYTWEHAKSIVLEAYGDFNSYIGKICKKFFDESWIHAPVIKGKSPGAFSASTVPSVHPYILVNYQGKSRDVFTLAHELGHGIHQFLAGNKQGHFNSSTPLTLAETASVFGEMLTFKLLLKRETDLNEKKALLANKVEDMLNTVVRQIAFFEFEKQIHIKRKDSELTSEEICQIWLKIQKQSLGPAIEFENEYKYYWTYIPHFIHSPFYVYAYAFGDCLVNTLFASYEEKPIGFDTKYISLLEAGGSLKYTELLKPFNLNPAQSDFWNKGLLVIESYIDQLEKLN